MMIIHACTTVDFGSGFEFSVFADKLLLMLDEVTRRKKNRKKNSICFNIVMIITDEPVYI